MSAAILITIGLVVGWLFIYHGVSSLFNRRRK